MLEGFEENINNFDDLDEISGFEIINEAVNDYIVESELTGIEDLAFISKLTKIILDSKEVRFDYKYNKKYSLKESDRIVKEFLEYLNPYYKEYYETRKNDGTILFDHNPQTIEPAFSSYDIFNKKRIIYIPLEKTIEDCFAIIHELMHDINMDITIENMARYFYTEGLSLLSELLLEDYLKEKNIKQCINPNNRGLYSLKSKAIEVDFNIKLIEAYLRDGYINISNLMDILNSYPILYDDDLECILYKISYDKELTLDDEQPYIIGGLMATYMYDRIKNNKNNIMELFELNQMLKYYNYSQVLEYLDLEIVDGNLSEDSYKQLEEKYKKYLKNRW